VKLSHMPGVEVQTVAHALDIHPFMLSRWRKEVRAGVLRGDLLPNSLDRWGRKFAARGRHRPVVGRAPHAER